MGKSVGYPNRQKGYSICLISESIVFVWLFASSQTLPYKIEGGDIFCMLDYSETETYGKKKEKKKVKCTVGNSNLSRDTFELLVLNLVQ